jgi:hypothetical protein
MLNHLGEVIFMRYFIGFLVTILLIVLLIFMLVSGGGDNKEKVPQTAKTLDSYAAVNSDVRVTIDKPVNAAQVHRQARVTVSADNVVYEELTGYDGQVTRQFSYPSSRAAYESFLLSLSSAGFTQGDTAEALREERGRCPLGDRYIYELRENQQSVQRFWSTSCNDEQSYLGNPALTLDLFRAQVPNYNNLSDAVSW